MLSVRDFTYEWLELYTESGHDMLASYAAAKAANNHQQIRLSRRKLTRLIAQFRRKIVRTYRVSSTG